MIQIDMVLKKETKGTVVYESVSPDAEITTVYIRKSAGVKAKKIRLAIDVQD